MNVHTTTLQMLPVEGDPPECQRTIQLISKEAAWIRWDGQDDSSADLSDRSLLRQELINIAMYPQPVARPTSLENANNALTQYRSSVNTYRSDRWTCKLDREARPCAGCPWPCEIEAYASYWPWKLHLRDHTKGGYQEGVG